MMEFRDAVKYLRSVLGLTQVELAMGLHINAITVGRWENGRTLPTRSITAALLEYARAKGASKQCIELLSGAINAAGRSRLQGSGDSLCIVEQASLRHLVDNASYAIWICDQETDELLYMNRKALDVTGADGPPDGGKCYERLMHRDSPCDACRKAELTADAQEPCEVACSADGVTYQMQGKLLQWDGRCARVFGLLEKDPAPDRVVPTETTEQMKTIFENINGGVSVVVYEEDGTVRHAFANERYYQLFGYTKEQYSEEVKSPRDTVHPDDRDSTAAAIAGVKTTKQAGSFRYRIIKRDKSIAYIRCNSSVTAMDGVSGFVLISILTDVTEAVQAEQQALVSGRRLDAIMQNMSGAVTASLFKDDGSVAFLFTNDRYHEMLGYTREQYQAEVNNPCQCIHPDDLDAVREELGGLSRVGDRKELLYRVVTRSGAVKWVRARISMMTFPDADGPVQLAVYMDVTDIVRTREKVDAQHERIEELLDETPSGIAIIEVDPRDVVGTMHTVYYNERFISYSGYGRKEYDALLKNNEMAFVFQEDLPVLLDDVAQICAGEVGATRNSLVRCHRKDGGFRWLMLTGRLTARRGDVCVINIAMMDVTERQEAIDRQRISDEMLRIAVEADQRVVIIYDVKENTCHVESRNLFSAKYGESFRNIPQSLIDLGIVAPESVPELCGMFSRIRNGEQRLRVALQLHNGEDRYEWYECNATTVFDAAGCPDHAVLVFHNITEQRVKEAVFRKWKQSIDTRPPESYSLFRCNLSRDASLDEQSGSLLKVVFSSDLVSFNERTKRYAEEYVYPDDRETYIKLLDSDLLLAMFYRGEHFAALDYRETANNGEAVWRRLTIETVEYPDSTDVQAFLLYEDIDGEKKAELTAKELAESDPLTGALNRSAFAEKVNAVFTEEPNAQCALMMLDMDGFKLLNDTFGHAAGDEALQEVAAVLRSYARSGDLVCRLGGDEFLVLLRDVSYDAVVGKIAQQICEHIRKAYSREVLLSASVGIAVFPRDGQSYDELYPNADKALYKVKQSGKGTYAFFSATGEQQTEEVTEAVMAVRPSPQSPRGAKRRMLIADDDEMSRLILANIFQNDYLIETAKNGAEAMIRLRHFGVSVSVVLLDLQMPGIDGFSVLRKMQNDVDLRVIPTIVVTVNEDRGTLLKAFELGAAEYVSKPVDADIIRMRVQAVVSKAENERLRAQNSYLMLQRNEETKYRTVLESTGTVVIEYDWRNHVFIYDNDMSKHVAGTYDHRGLWQVFLSDLVADSVDVKAMQDMLISLASNRETTRDSRLVKLKTPADKWHWFRLNIYKTENDFGLAEKMILTFNDVHEEVLANERLRFQATRDELTGLYNRAGFLEEAAELIAIREPGHYVMACIDIEHFQVINDQYGTEKGDEVLRHMAGVLGDFAHRHNGICCRYMADEFAVIYPAELQHSAELEATHKAAAAPDCIPRPLRLRIGRCLISDTSLPVSALFDRAAMAEALAKGRYDTYIIDYDESMRDSILREQQVVVDMVDALNNGEFEPWFQPQYNHATGALIGAEALVRWRKNGKIVFPNDFIPVFEKNGFIYEVDQYVWRQVCMLLRRWLDEGRDPVPVSVNISRHDMFQENFVGVLTGLVAEYRLPAELLRLEITESAFAADTRVVTDIAGKLVAAGFTVEIDDFGSGYSSLNTLKDVPASILKLDMRFFETTENSARGGNIVEAIVRMAKWLGMAVIAEGVEDQKQADYLKSIGCYYIQGYVYSKPLRMEDYERRMAEGIAEHRLSHLETLETMDADLFWDPKSMETLIFNSYVGGACIFELSDAGTELLRVNESYFKALGALLPADTPIEKAGIYQFLRGEEREKAKLHLHRTIASSHEESCELCLTDGTHTEHLRMTGRVIARATDRFLFYAVIQNITAQRRLERERVESAERLSVIMSNVNGGVSALEIDDDGISHVIFHNDKYYELYGYTRTEGDGTEVDPLSFIVPEDFPGVMEKVKKLKTDGVPAVIDYGILKRDGSRAQLRVNASLMTMEGYGPIIASVVTDVTEQRTLEDQLRAVVENINGGVTAFYLHDGKLRFVLSNDRYYAFLGYTRAQYDAEVDTVFTLIHPDDRERVQTQFADAVRAEKPYTIEYRIVRRDGAVRHILCNANIMHVFGVKEPVQLAVYNDITMLREAQIKEQDRARQTQAIMQNIQGGVSAAVLRDGDRIELAFANDGYYELFGYERAQFENQVPSLMELVVPEDRGKMMETVLRLARERGNETYEYRCRRRDGSVIWVQTSSTVISLSGLDDTVLLAVTTDITALRRAEEQSMETADRLSAVMNAMTSGMTAMAFDGKHTEFLLTNDRFYQMHGVEPENCRRNGIMNAMKRVHPDDRRRVGAVAMQTTEIGESAAVEYRVLSPDGTTRWIKALMSVTRLIGVDRPVQVTIYADITDERQSGEQLRFLNESAGEMLAQPDSEKALRNALRKIMDFFAGERAYIFELDDETQTADNTYEVCADGVTAEIGRLQGIPYDTQQYWFDFFNQTGFVVIPDVAAIEDREVAMRELLLAQSIRSIIVVPLRRDGKLIGYMGVDNPTAAVDQVDRLLALANYIAVLMTRRDLMNAVENEHRRMQQLVNDTPGGFVRMELFEDKAPSVVSVNDGFCRMIGMTRAEAMKAYGDNALACLAEEDALAARQEMKNAYASGGQYTSTCRLRRKGGELFWVMLFGRFLREEGGKLYLNAYFTDITEQRSVEQLQIDLLENLPFGAALFDYDGSSLTAIHINKRYWEVVGRSTAGPVMDALHPDDRLSIRQEIEAAIRLKRNPESNCRILCGDGTYLPFHVVGTLTPREGGHWMLYLVYTPIDKDEQSMREILPIALSTMVSSSEDMSYVKDRDLRFICVSQSIADLVRAESPRDLVGKSAEEVFGAEFAEKLNEDDRRIIRTGEAVTRKLEHIPAADGTIRLARTSKYPILSAAGSAIGVYCVSHDITMHREKESQLELLTATIPGGLAAYSISKAGFKPLYFNDGFYDFSGYTREEYVAMAEKDPLVLMLPEDRQGMLDMVHGFADRKEDGMTGTCTYRCRTKGGAIRWMNMKAVLTQVGEDAYMLNAVQVDITERINAEQRQVDLLENLPFGAAMYEYDGKSITTLHINKRYTQLVNREVNRTSENTYPIESIHPDDRRLVFDEIRSAIAEKRNAACDVRLLYGRDEYRPFHLDASIVPGSGGKYTLYVAYAPITDQEQEFKITTERLKLLSNSIPGGIATFRCMPGKIEPIYFNDGICALIGYSREEVDSRQASILDLIVDEDKPVIRRQIELLMSGETALDYSVRIHTKSGGLKWVECMASVTGRESDASFLVSAVLTDVTEHQEERERLRVSEELNRLAIDQSGKIISRYDAAKRTLTLPYRLPEIYRVPRLLENMPEEQIRLGRISPDTADAYRGIFERIHAGDAFGEAVYQQQSVLGWRWLKSQFTTVFANDGSPVSAVITFEDITEQREKEAVYYRWQNAMAERSEDTYTVVRCNLNKPTLLDSWEGNLLRVRFTDPAQHFNARTAEYAERYLYADDRAAFREFLNSDTMLAEYHRGHRTDSIDYREENGDGSVRWLRLSVDLVEYPDSTDIEAYLLFEDINEQKHAELATLRRAETDPLTGVLNRVTFAQRVNAALGSYRPHTIHALMMLDVDGFKRVNDVFGHGAGDQTLIDIANALTHFCRKDDLVGRLGGDEFFLFLADIGSEEAAARKARQICDMTRKELSADVQISASVGIALQPQDGDGFEVLYKAADAALYRAKNAGKDGYAFSTGEPVIDAGMKWHGSRAAAQAASGKRQKTRRVLIVDDNRTAQMMLDEILRGEYDVETATDGASALAMLRHYGTAVSAVLLDLMMPGMSGFEVLEEMQRDERIRTIPVIVVSADEDRETALRVIRAGAYDLITKPVDADLLRIRVESAVSRAENERLRAQNSYLAIRNSEVNSYRAALERTGTMVITLDPDETEFSYSPAVAKKLSGQYDGRPFWSILRDDQVTDEKTVSQMQELVQALIDDTEHAEGRLRVRLKAASGRFRLFELNAFKEQDDYGLAPKVILTLTEETPKHKDS